MRDPDRIPKILAMIEELWKMYPDQRLMQLLTNTISGYDAFNLEDGQLRALLDGHIAATKYVVSIEKE